MKNYYDLEGDGGSHIVEQVTARQEQIDRALRGIKSVVAIGSGKGGVGKSTLTTLLACAFADRGSRTAILDADLNGPSQARLSGVSEVLMVPGKEGLVLPKSARGFGVVSVGSVLPEGEALRFDSVAVGDSFTWRATREFALLAELLSGTDWGELDLLLVDLPPGAERTLQYAEALGQRASFVLVTTPSDLTRGVVQRSIAALADVPNRILGYVENMSGYYCSGCHEVKPLFPEGREVQLNLPRLGSVPFDPDIAAALDRGELPGSEPGSATLDALGCVMRELEVALGSQADQQRPVGPEARWPAVEKQRGRRR